MELWPGPSTIVRVGYLTEHRRTDESWLAAVLAQHYGELSDDWLLSDPPQQEAFFAKASDAHAFIAKVRDAGRWRIKNVLLPP